MTPVPTASSIPPVPSDRDRTEPVGTPLLRNPPPTDALPVTTTDLDALGAAADVKSGDSAARYSHADWAREQHSEPACNAATRYIPLGRPEVFPADVLSRFPSHQRPPFSEVQELVKKGRLHTTDAGIILPALQPSPPQASDTQPPMGRTACLLNDEPIRIYVPLLMRLWDIQACHSTASCHLGTTRTLRMLKRFYW